MVDPTKFLLHAPLIYIPANPFDVNKIVDVPDVVLPLVIPFPKLALTEITVPSTCLHSPYN